MPVIGNGDVFSTQDASALLAETGCDAVMLARAAIHNPWIFRSLSSEGEGPAPSPLEEEVRLERDRYLLMAEEHGSKAKYTAFHEANFARLAAAAATGKWGLPSRSSLPRSSHFS